MGFRLHQVHELNRLASPCTFYHNFRDIRAVVHADDFAMLGNCQELDWFKSRIESKLEIKCKERMGEREGDMKSIRILNRIVTWTPDGIEYESDQRHAEIIVKQMGLKPGSKSVAAPAVRVKPGEGPGDENKIEPNEQTILQPRRK